MKLFCSALISIENGADINATMYESFDTSRALFNFMSLGTVLHKVVELAK